jgi:hypothetical protein
MSEYEIEESLRFTAINELPNLRKGAEVLSRLKDWTNSCSDGWPYWQKPARAADRLMNHLADARTQYHRGNGDGDITEAELKKAITPIKSFLTRREVAPEEKARIIG